MGFKIILCLRSCPRLRFEDKCGLEAPHRNVPDLSGIDELELLPESELESSDGSDGGVLDLEETFVSDPRRALSKKFSAATLPGVTPRDGSGVFGALGTLDSGRVVPVLFDGFGSSCCFRSSSLIF
jgi:hypothetical protein